MNHVSNGAAALSYGTSLGSGGYWLLQLLDKVSPSQWIAIGVITSFIFSLLTFLTNFYFKMKDNQRKETLNRGRKK